jgi:CheY-like chemotaxis protein
MSKPMETPRGAAGVVALFSASEDVVELVKGLLTDSGDAQSLVCCPFDDLKKRTVNFEKYMEEYNPEVAIFDISQPYEENWGFFATMRDSQTMQGRGLVIITSNKYQLDVALNGDSSALEFVGQSVDRNLIQAAIERETTKTRRGRDGHCSEADFLPHNPDSPPSRQVVALFNSNQDTVELVARMLNVVGHFCLDTCHFADLKTGNVDFSAYLTTHNPTVVIIDISPPYDENWAFFKTMRDSKAMEGRGVVLTTTNKMRLDEFVRKDSTAIEIVGKPYDFKSIVKAIEAAVRRPPEVAA